MDAAQRLEEYLKATIESKEKELDTLGGELSALRSTYATLRQFRAQAEQKGPR